jgi:hypothetical protein
VRALGFTPKGFRLNLVLSLHWMLLAHSVADRSITVLYLDETEIEFHQGSEKYRLNIKKYVTWLQMSSKITTLFKKHFSIRRTFNEIHTK